MRREQLNNCVELLFNQERGLQPRHFRGTYSHQFSQFISIIGYISLLLFFFYMLTWCKRCNRGFSNADVCVCVPARRKAGKVKSPISTLGVFPKAFPVCHLKKAKHKTKISYDDVSIDSIDTEITHQLVDLWHI